LPFIFLLVNRTQKKLLLSVFPLFILANLFRFTPDMINNHKFVNIWMIFITSLTAGVLAKLTKLSWGGKLISFLLFLSLTFSGIIDFFPIINDHYFTIPDYQHSDIGNWIALHIHPRSVFLTTSYLYNPASLTGRRTFVDYGYFNWSLGYNETARRQALPQILSPNADLATICSTISQFDLDYLLIAPGNGDIPNIDPHLSTIAKTTIPTYTSTEEYQVFTVQSLCPSV
jgi:hypothetical protein